MVLLPQYFLINATFLLYCTDFLCFKIEEVPSHFNISQKNLLWTSLSLLAPGRNKHTHTAKLAILTKFQKNLSFVNVKMTCIHVYNYVLHYGVFICEIWS